MMTENTTYQGDYSVPRFKTVIPVSLYVNGQVVPPIETMGEITSFTTTTLQIRCEQKIPIPSKGKLRFTLGDRKEEVELQVDFVQRVELGTGLWLWRSKKKYEMRASLSDCAQEMVSKYRYFIHRLFFGGRYHGAALPNPVEFENHYV